MKKEKINKKKVDKKEKGIKEKSETSNKNEKIIKQIIFSIL